MVIVTAGFDTTSLSINEVERLMQRIHAAFTIPVRIFVNANAARVMHVLTTDIRLDLRKVLADRDRAARAWRASMELRAKLEPARTPTVCQLTYNRPQAIEQARRPRSSPAGPLRLLSGGVLIPRPHAHVLHSLGIKICVACGLELQQAVEQEYGFLCWQPIPASHAAVGRGLRVPTRRRDQHPREAPPSQHGSTS